MRRPAQILLQVRGGEAERIGSRQSTYNIAQCEVLCKTYYGSLWAKLSVLEADSPPATLANMRVCMYTGCCREPNRAHRKRAAHPQHWPMRELSRQLLYKFKIMLAHALVLFGGSIFTSANGMGLAHYLILPITS